MFSRWLQLHNAKGKKNLQKKKLPSLKCAENPSAMKKKKRCGTRCEIFLKYCGRYEFRRFSALYNATIKMSKD
jgi:hypothetical protein